MNKEVERSILSTMAIISQVEESDEGLYIVKTGFGRIVFDKNDDYVVVEHTSGVSIGIEQVSSLSPEEVQQMLVSSIWSMNSLTIRLTNEWLMGLRGEREDTLDSWIDDDDDGWGMGMGEED